jgi:hypothetical protein
MGSWAGTVLRQLNDARTPAIWTAGDLETRSPALAMAFQAASCDNLAFNRGAAKSRKARTFRGKRP